ncbi:MAG TPA: YqaA family protein [Deferrimonas sp.]|jgi:membrane protein YqaA with SNARE-associated domain
MEEILLPYGYPALFLLSFCAATLLPLGSEWLLATLLLQGSDPVLGVATATAGNTLGALTTYAVGLWGSPLLFGRLLRIDGGARERAELFYRRWGPWSLLFSWVPVLGDPLCLAAGVLRVGFVPFLLPVAVGKLGRYLVVALLVLQGERLLS